MYLKKNTFILALFTILILSICIIFLLLKKKTESFLNITAKYFKTGTNGVFGNIALVGNGPLSETQRKEINTKNFNFVLRFNDMKNYRNGDRVDVLVCREWEDTHKYAKSNHCLKCKKMLVGVHAREDLRANGADMYIETKKKHYFELFNRPENVNLNQQPSTGAIVISEIQNNSKVKKIDVYGMNFNFKSIYHKKNEGSIIRKYCEKCIFHETPSSSYLP